MGTYKLVPDDTDDRKSVSRCRTIYHFCFEKPLVSASGVLHVLCDRCVADSVGCGGDGRLAAVAAATAVEAGHVDPVQAVVVLPSSVAQRLVFAVFIAPANTSR